MRMTPALTKMLRRYHPLWMSLHFTHPDEMTPEVAEACGRLADAGIPLGSQTVLLKGVNDDVATLKKLFHELLKIRVRPYYLYQCDPISGSSHFRTTRRQGPRADLAAARLHDRLRRAELRRRRPGRRRQDRAAAGLRHRPRRRRPAAAQLRAASKCRYPDPDGTLGR